MTPNLIGPQAERALKASKLTVQSLISGAYLVSGPFFIQSGAASLYLGVDLKASWADATHVVWRYFNMPGGASYTLNVTGRAFFACGTAPQSIATNNAQMTSQAPTAPSWVAGCRFGMVGTLLDSAQAPLSNYLEPSLPLQWYDSNTTPGTLTSLADLSTKLNAVTHDGYGDIPYPPGISVMRGVTPIYTCAGIGTPAPVINSPDRKSVV